MLLIDLQYYPINIKTKAKSNLKTADIERIRQLVLGESF